MVNLKFRKTDGRPWYKQVVTGVLKSMALLINFLVFSFVFLFACALIKSFGIFSILKFIVIAIFLFLIFIAAFCALVLFWQWAEGMSGYD